MSVRILIGDVLDRLADLDADSVDCVVTSPPYWGLRDYDVDGQIGMEPTLGEHLDVMVRVFDAVRRVMKPEGTLWLNYGDCYATKPNGRSAAATKAAGTDDRTFRDKPFSTVGPVYGHLDREYEKTARAGKTQNLGNLGAQTGPRVVGVGMLKPKDLCMVPNRLAIALQDAGWWVRSEIIWGKPNPMPDSSGRYRPSTAHEKLFLLTKSATSYYDSEAVRMPAAEASLQRWSQDIDSQAGSDRANAGRKTNGSMKAVGGKQTATAASAKGLSAERRYGGFNDRWDAAEASGEVRDSRLLRNYEPDLSPIIPPEVWEIATAAFSEAHFATFPPALVAPCIMAGCPKGGLVLDPFGGAGTTGLVADRLGRDAVLIELNPEYAEIARKRIEGDAGMFAEVAAA
ncbi:DNA-methyltransferase [Pelagerythrobacter aerophilus]|uniref:Methyltransferase n=1 Tax=Pelagerythrobacter aerophilus TaxID=2306995 RepID=A0A418NK00_9SPHN|nr:site-specific DNA-methyltransferase [Pelagerythrobacter aerophilus]RIV79554.1 site-specific DNA-methyltransferase [Pelagerythrobacter aerophilus]